MHTSLKLAVGLISTLVITPALAAPNECNAADFKGKSVVFSDTWTQLFYEQQMNQTNQGSRSGSLGIDIFDVVDLTGQREASILIN